MSDKKQITINLEGENIERLDKLCTRLNMSRAQAIRLLLSGKISNIKFICDTLIQMEEGLF